MRNAALSALTMMALLTAGCEPGRRAEPPAGAERIRALVAEYDRAVARKDREWLSGFLTDEFVYFTSRGGVWDRDRFLDFLSAPTYQPEYAERGELVIHRAGGTAVVESRWRGRGTYEGGTFDDDQRCSLAFAWLDDDWHLAAEDCTNIAEPGPEESDL